MRHISNELALLQRQINEEKEEIYQLQRETAELIRQPEIEGCYSACFEDEHGNQGDIFAVSWDDLDKMNKIDGFHTLNPL